MAVSYQTPPWVRGARTAEMYAHGFPMGAQVAEAAARIQEAQVRMQMEQQRAQREAEMVQLKIQLQQQQAQRDSAQEQQKLEVLKSYHEQQGQLKQEELKQQEEKIQATAQIAARKFQAQQAVQTDAKAMIDSGMSEPKAYMLATMHHASELGVPMGGIGTLATDIAKMDKPAFVPGPVQGQPVLDPSGKPVPGMLGIPNAQGTGQSVHNIPGGPKDPSVQSLQTLYDNTRIDPDIPKEQIAAIKAARDKAMQKQFPVDPNAKPTPQLGLPQAGLSAIANYMRSSKEPASSKLPGTEPVKQQGLGVIQEGAVMGGYKFLGGDPADEKNWDSVIKEEGATLPGEE